MPRDVCNDLIKKYKK